ncbi:hypothetical protein A3715_16885 [Oleiphilus sp. HI0009]|nr:hypothetical protein A3715_16885 [Oleiphilus sp. HI0009]
MTKLRHRQKKLTHDWAGSKKREVLGSNGKLQNPLLMPVKKGQVTEFRKAFSAYARATKGEMTDGRKNMFTHSFEPFKTKPSLHQCELADKAYQSLHSYLPGSLAHFLLSAHALGFRIFSKSGEATAFQASSKIEAYESKLASELACVDLSIQNLTISTLFNALTTSVRGKGEETSADPLIARFYTLLTGKPLSRDTQGPERDLAEVISRKIASSFGTWKEMTANPLQSLQFFEEELHALDANVSLSPAFDVLIKMNDLQGDLKNRTIVFDPDAPVFEYNAEDPADIIIKLTARYAKEAVIKNQNVGNYVKNAITTTNANGLGWLLNKGLSLLPVSTDDELLEFIGVERSHPSCHALIELIAQLEAPELFEKNVFSDTRSEVQGMIDSAVSNHIARLSSSRNSLSMDSEELERLIKSFQIHTPHCSLFIGAQSLSQQLESLPEALQSGVNSADILLGSTQYMLTNSLVEESIATYQRTLNRINYLSGVAGQINGAIKRKAIDGEKIHLPAAWSELISLPFIGQPVIDVESDLAHLKNQYQTLSNEFDTLISALQKNFDLNFNKALLNRTQHFEAMCRSTKKNALSKPEIVSYRDLLARLTSCLYRGSLVLRRAGIEVLKKHKIFESNSELREHVHERKHFVFVSPLDRKAKKLLRLTDSRPDLLHVIDEILQHDNLENKDRESLWLVRSGYLLAGLPDQLSSSFINLPIITQKGDRRLIDLIQYDQINRDAFVMLVTSAFKSNLSGLQYRANKQSFVVTRTLSPYLGSKLVYVPKDKDWLVPSQMFEGRFADILQSDYMVWKDAGRLCVIDTAKHLSNIKKSVFSSEEVLAFLRELPHRTFIQTEVRGLGVNVDGIAFNNGDIPSLKTFSNCVQVKVSRTNTSLVQTLNRWFEGGKVSPPSIQFERAYYKKDDQIHEDAAKRKIRFQMPATELVHASDDAGWTPSYLLGIDPGEYGMGLSLVSINNGEVLDSGFIHINSLINFASKKSNHQTKVVPRQQYKSPYANYLEQSKDSAAGDIAHILDRLIYKLNALPVFEALSGNSQSAADQVWTKVLSFYTWGDNDAQNSIRKQHWFGASHWDIKGMLRQPPTEKKPKPYIAFPGSQVSSYGNSQRCSCCGRNPIEQLREMAKDTSIKELKIRNSEIQLFDGTIKLFNPDPSTVIERRRHNLGPSRIPVADRTFKNISPSSLEFKELITIVSRSIRHSPEFIAKKRGIGSEYFCAYSDCNSSLNSEANAAANVAQKFQKQLFFEL